MQRGSTIHRKPAKRIAFTRSGASAVAIPRAQALRAHLRNEQGWRIFSITGEEQNHQMFVSADNGPQLARQAVQLKK